jgi:hypothetical protein
VRLAWHDCLTDPLPWISLRELLLSLLHTPALFLPLVATTAALFTWGLPHRCATLLYRLQGGFERLAGKARVARVHYI